MQGETGVQGRGGDGGGELKGPWKKYDVLLRVVQICKMGYRTVVFL